MEALDPLQHVYGGYTSAGYMHELDIFTSAPYTACTGQYMSLQLSNVGNSL